MRLAAAAVALRRLRPLHSRREVSPFAAMCVVRVVYETSRMDRASHDSAHSREDTVHISRQTAMPAAAASIIAERCRPPSQAPAMVTSE